MNIGYSSVVVTAEDNLFFLFIVIHNRMQTIKVISCRASIYVVKLCSFSRLKGSVFSSVR
jgi:hypothetical protein